MKLNFLMGNISKLILNTRIINIQNGILMVVCLIVITTIKPVFMVLSQNEKVSYSLCDDYDEKDFEEEKEESKEESKEEKKEEKEQEKIRHTNNNSNPEYELQVITAQSSTRSYIELNQFASELYSDILLPPPKQA